jgi:hypothetical protein
MKNWTLIILAVMVCAGGWPGAVIAQDQNPKEALQRASELARDEQFDEAIAIWLSVLDRLEGRALATTQKKLGVAYQQTGRLPEAWHYLSLYLASPDGQSDETMANWLQEVETALKEDHVKVFFSCSPERLTLHIPASKSGTATQSAFRIPDSAFVWWLKPGKHEIGANAPGYQARTVKVYVDKADTRGKREIRLAAIVPDKVPTEAVTAPSDTGTPLVTTPGEMEPPSRALEWALLGSGLALGVTGGIFHGLAYSKNGDLDSKYLDEAEYPYGTDAKKAYDAAYDDEVQPKEITAYVLYGIGGAALVAGVATWAMRSENSDAESMAFAVTPMGLPGGTGALMTLQF